MNKTNAQNGKKQQKKTHNTHKYKYICKCKNANAYANAKIYIYSEAGATTTGQRLRSGLLTMRIKVAFLTMDCAWWLTHLLAFARSSAGSLPSAESAPGMSTDATGSLRPAAGYRRGHGDRNGR